MGSCSFKDKKEKIKNKKLHMENESKQTTRASRVKFCTTWSENMLHVWRREKGESINLFNGDATSDFRGSARVSSRAIILVILPDSKTEPFG